MTLSEHVMKALAPPNPNAHELNVLQVQLLSSPTKYVFGKQHRAFVLVDWNWGGNFPRVIWECLFVVVVVVAYFDKF
jgi:hypothetical protein